MLDVLIFFVGDCYMIFSFFSTQKEICYVQHFLSNCACTECWKVFCCMPHVFMDSQKMFQNDVAFMKTVYTLKKR
jgi:hypothetical protein